MKITVLGAGSWGTALAAHLAAKQFSVTLWGRDAEHMAQMQTGGFNNRYLPDIRLPPTLAFSHKLDAVVPAVDAVVIATPCHSFRQILDSIAPLLSPQTSLVWACKGITDGQLLHSIIEQRFGQAYPAAIVSGPSFAAELAESLPTAATVASTELQTASNVSGWFHSDTFRAYASDDIIGVQLAGALKNVYAIAAGISDGLGFGANARAALITRGLAELMRLGSAMGARPDTLMGLSGVGDLVLTCTDNQSRNRRFGLAIGQGMTRDAAVESIGQVVEGINTSREAAQLAASHNVDMPITEEVFNVIHQNKEPHKAVADLLSRSQKPELQ